VKVDTSLQDWEATERLLSREPVVVRRRVIWGECDPARVVYTPRFGDYLASAFGWFVRVVLADLMQLEDGTPIGTPMKALALEFHRTLKMDDFFDMSVQIGDIRRRTFDVLVTARSLSGDVHFTGRLSPILIKGSTFEPVELTDAIRSTLESYKAATS
jgi:acyl-CoA thioesterase FadM